jgi:hypothetical protein
MFERDTDGARRSLFSTACLVTCAVSLSGRSGFTTQGRATEPLRIILPPDVDTATCDFQYQTVGPSSCSGCWDRPKPGLHGYEIDVTREGTTVEMLRASLACTGYQTETFTAGLRGDLTNQSAPLRLEPLKTVRFTGLVRGWAAPTGRQYVEVHYFPVWKCEFFHLADCLIGPRRIASVSVAADGRFSVGLPDYAHDPVVSAYKNRGHFRFQIRDNETGNFPFTLMPFGAQNGLGDIPVQVSYPGEQWFNLVPR